MSLVVNSKDIELFVTTLFQRAQPNTWVLLRNFRDDNSNQTFQPNNWAAVEITAPFDAAPIVNAAIPLAEAAANAGPKVVFCPPVCTFLSASSAAESNVANGLAILIECDNQPTRALELAEDLLGPATLVVASGGLYTDPKTKESEEKLHVYWLLDSPTENQEDHNLLKEARRLAAAYVGGDPTSGPLSHPIRWAGSWHRKGDPRLARVVKSTSNVVDLTTVLELLRSVNPQSNGSPLQLEADIANIRSALNAIPNKPESDWDFWNTVGLATWRSSGGSDEGYKAWEEWSATNPKHDTKQCQLRWRHYHGSPPTRLGIGWLYARAKENNPKWRPPSVDTPVGAYQRSSTGAILPNRYNIKLSLQKFQAKLSYDSFVNRVLVNGEPVNEHILRTLWFRIESEEFYQPKKEYYFDAVEDIALENSTHPVLNYLEGLKWDGKERLENWLLDIAKAVPTVIPDNVPYIKAVGRLVLLGAVSRIYEPGCKFDEMLVLINPRQGTNKSSALRILAVNDDWFTDSLSLSATEKEILEHITGKWIVETGELKGMRWNDIETLKAFLSRQTDRARMAYGHFVTERPRQSIFIGTTNNTEFLRDEQNRRFWPVRVGEIDLEALRTVRDQLWAEAVTRYKAGESTRLSPSLYALAEFEQERYRLVDGYEARLERYFGEHANGDPLITGRVLTTDVFKIAGTRNHLDEIRAGIAMHKLGWTRERVTVARKKAYVYARGEDDRDIYVHPDLDMSNPTAPVTSWIVTHSPAPTLDLS